MRSPDSRHLAPDEIVERVFPSDDRPAAVPVHLASCAECQGRVARLRVAWLLDRGAVAGVVEALPGTFWDAQVASVMQAVASNEPAVTPASSGVHPFPPPTHRFFMTRRPVVAFGSIAAALLLAAGIAVSRRQAPAPVADKHPTPVSMSVVSDKADDELLRDIDHVLSEDASLAPLVPEEML